MADRRWKPLADAQEGLLSHRQLRGLGISYGQIRHHVSVGRWATRSSQVVSTTTGPLSPRQHLWLGVLHAGPTAMIGGLSAAAYRGLRHWERDSITVWVANPMSFEPLDGFRFFRTRRPFGLLVGPESLPVAKIEPATLLFAAHETSFRAGVGAMAAVCQQRLSTPHRLDQWRLRLRPLRRSKPLGEHLGDLMGGALALSEIDVRRACKAFGLVPPRRQTKRRDTAGRIRYTDCEWDLPDGTVLVLEVDGAYHDEVAQATLDRRRPRRLTSRRRLVIACTAYEVRHEPEEVMKDLVALGVARVAG